MANQPTSPAGPLPWQHIPSPGKVYGTARVGERGQIAIPADARRELAIESGAKVVVFGNRVTGAVTLVKADLFEDFADFFMTKLGKLGESAQSFFGQFTDLADEDYGEAAAPATAEER
jgi:AbrB family looped-hinge helix DNA binding protein